MSAESRKLFLVDGSSYIFRAYYAIRPLSTSTGVPTNAVLGFAKMLLKLIKEDAPGLLGLAFDPPGKSFRHQIYDSYKANREAPPEDLVPQFPLIHELVACMDIPVLMVEGFEADDVLATLAQQGASQGYQVVLVSGDKDLMQLVSPSIHMFDPLKEKHYDAAAVQEKFGVPPEHIADLLALSGDSSDNVPGVPRVGPKSAAKLLQQYGSLEAILEGLPQVAKPKAFERSVLEHADVARLSKKLTVLDAKAPISLSPEHLAYSAPQSTKLLPFLQKIEAFGLIRDFGLQQEHQATREQAAPAAPQAAARTDSPARQRALSPIDRSTYRTITQVDELQALLHSAKEAGRLSLDLETTSLDPNRADIVGIALCVPGGTPSYVPVAHRYLGVPKQIPYDVALQQLKPILEDSDVAKVGQNLKYEHTVLARCGIELAGIREDAMLAAYVLNPSRPSYGLDSLAREILGYETIKYGEVAGVGKKQTCFSAVDVQKATEYAAEDADIALRLCDMLIEEVHHAGMQELLFDLEIPLIPVLATMERTGIRVDRDRLHTLSVEFSQRLAAVEKKAQEAIGEPINLSSPKQLSQLFFERLGLEPVKKTKTGLSTDQEVLEVLAHQHPLPKMILEYRMLGKLKSTYIDGLLKMLNPHTGRVHTSFNQTGAATGRLSSSDPNLQNIPIRSEDGRRIREVFVPEPGCTLIAADYSQIELRVMAHLSGDAHFVEAFRQGEDIHDRTAREILSGGEKPDAEMRRRAKAINFGILYGLSEFGLAKQLGISRSEARAYITAYFARYPQIRDFLDTTIATARERGFVTTLAGRRRFLPELRSKNKNVRQGAERIAMNTPIQGSAADLIKMAMLQVSQRLREEKLQAKLLLQVHDELVLEAPTNERDTVIDLVRETMCQVKTLAVPLVVDVGHGENWARAH